MHITTVFFTSCFQYKEEVDTLNESSRERPRGELVASMERESRLMRDVQRENGELRAALEDHRKALELIMSKYRQHTEKRIWESRIDFTAAVNEKQQEVCGCDYTILNIVYQIKICKDL